MKIKVGNQTLIYYEELNVTLEYEGIADTFNVAAWTLPIGAKDKNTPPKIVPGGTTTQRFSPSDFIAEPQIVVKTPDTILPATKKTDIFKPGEFNKCQIFYTNSKGESELVITGTILSPSLSIAARPTLNTFSGYSVTGVIGDSQVFGGIVNSGIVKDSEGNITFTNLSLKEIGTRVCADFGLTLVVDDNVKSECDKPFGNAVANPTETCECFLSDLCSQRNVIMSHTTDGQLLFTKSKATKNNKYYADTTAQFSSAEFLAEPQIVVNSNRSEYSAPIYYLHQGQILWTEMRLKFNGQMMHSFIQVVGQANDSKNASNSTITNPYVANTFRYKRVVQNNGDDNDTPLTARNVLGEELKALTVEVDIAGWELGGRLIRPNSLVAITNPDIDLYKKTLFFITSVSFKRTAGEITSTITCVLPECYNDEDVINIFA